MNTDTHTTQSSYTQPCTMLVFTLPDMTATDTHTQTHTCDQINFNSPVREQISRQPFISSASLTLPLHCPLLSIDLCHSLVVLVSVLLPRSSSILPFNIPLFCLLVFCPSVSLPLHCLYLYLLRSLSVSLYLSFLSVFSLDASPFTLLCFHCL